MLLVHIVAIATHQVLPRACQVGIVLLRRIIVLTLSAVHSILPIKHRRVIAVHILLIMLIMLQLLLHCSLLL